jgi:hypothetical protein
MTHPLEWSRADVQAWCVTRELPPTAAALIAAQDGPGLWMLTKESLNVPAQGEGAEASDLCALWDAVAMLHQQYELEDVLLAVQIMAGENPAFASALDKEAHDQVRDHFYSLLVLEREVNRHKVSEADSELASRLQQEAQTDIFSLRVAQETEQMRLDHELALRTENADDHEADRIIALHGRDVVTAPPVEATDEEDCEIVEATNEHDIERQFRLLNDEREPAPAQGEAQSQCVACLTVHHDAKLLPCGHYLCTADLGRMCRAALKDNSMIPPACCEQKLPVEVMRLVLNKDELFQICQRVSEKAVANKMYCPNAVCSHLMNLDQLLCFRSSESSVMACVSCEQPICILCKSFAHDGECQHVDPGDLQLIELAALEGWKRCKSCYTFVSLKHGCNHITCVCNYEFCYVCEEEWTNPKSCPCPLWIEENLIHEQDRRLLAQEEQLGRRLDQVSNKCLLLDALFFQKLTVPLELTGRTKLQS